MLRRLHASPLGSTLRAAAPSKHIILKPHRSPVVCSSAAFEGSLPSDESGKATPPEQDYKPFPRIKETDPYRLLGIESAASFEEVRDAKNFLYQHYKWHEASREAIDHAVDKILEEKIKVRTKDGMLLPGTKRVRRVQEEQEEAGIMGKLRSFLDPAVSRMTIVNEGSIYLLLALWARNSSDGSFPLAFSVIYSVFMFQSKRVKRTPEGPFLFNKPLVGAIISGALNAGLAAGVVLLLKEPITTAFVTTAKQVSAIIMISIVAVLGIFLK